MLRQISLFLGLTFLFLLFKSPPAQVLPYPSYQPPSNFASYLKPYSRFSSLTVIPSALLQFPQDIQIDPITKSFYTGNFRGTIFKILPNNTITTFLQSKGPILRIQLDQENNLLYFIDVALGICRADLETKNVEVLVSFGPYGAINSFILADEIIYFTQTSSRFAFSELPLAILSARPDGNVYRYDISSNIAQKIITNLYSPNGIQISPSKTHLFIAQMGLYRIIKFNLQTLTSTIVINNLEASPDNLRFNNKGQLWIGLPIFRDNFQQFLMQQTWLRSLISKLSPGLINKFVKSTYCGAMKISEDGKVLDYIKEGVEKFKYLSTAMEFEGELYLGSFKFAAVGRVPIEIENKNGKRNESDKREEEL